MAKQPRFELCRDLLEIPNVGPRAKADLERIGIRVPGDLAGRSPMEMYRALCAATGVRHDLCVLDVFAAIVDFATGGPPRPWHAFSAARKAGLSSS